MWQVVYSLMPSPNLTDKTNHSLSQSMCKYPIKKYIILFFWSPKQPQIQDIRPIFIGNVECVKNEAYVSQVPYFALMKEK